MGSKEITPVNAGFESLKQTNEHNAEYWRARDLQPLLGYPTLGVRGHCSR